MLTSKATPKQLFSLLCRDYMYSSVFFTDILSNCTEQIEPSWKSETETASINSKNEKLVQDTDHEASHQNRRKKIPKKGNLPHLPPTCMIEA